MLHVYIITVAMKMQPRVPFLLTYICHGQQCSNHWKLLLQKCSEAFYLLLRYIRCCQQSETHISRHVKCWIFLSHFNQIWIFVTDFFKSPKYKISQKSVWWDPCRQTDMTKLIGTFCAYVNAPKNFTRMEFYITNCTLHPKSNCHVHWCTRQSLSPCTQQIKYDD